MKKYWFDEALPGNWVVGIGDVTIATTTKREHAKMIADALDLAVHHGMTSAYDAALAEVKT